MSGERFRPSNGDEGIQFMAQWCDRCRHDAAFQAGTGDGCRIVAATMAYHLDHPHYPREWQYGADGQPVCAAFEPLRVRQMAGGQ